MSDNDERMILLGKIVEAVRQHFSECNMAHLMFQSLVDQGMRFFTFDETHVAVPDNVVIYYLFLALQVGHDNAVQQLFPTVHGAPPDDDDELMVFLAEVNWADVNWNETSSPEVTPLAPPAVDPLVVLPVGAAILGPQFNQLAGTTILRHVIHQVRTTYSRGILAGQIWNMFAQQEVPLSLIDRALEVGMDQALAEAAVEEE